MSLFNVFSGKKENAQKVPATPFPPKKILVVEDDQMLRDFYVELLQQQGYAVLQATNGQEGFDTIVAQKPNLVLLDLMMPIMDGKAMLHTIRQIPEFKNLPVIVLTNAGDVDSIQYMKLYENVNEFFIKANVNPEEIINRVKNLA